MKLEDFIKQNREAFDTEMPSAEVWAQIEHRLHPSQQGSRIPLYGMLSIAASFTILIVAGLFFAYSMGKTEGQEFAMEKMELQRYYQQQIDQKMTRLASYGLEDDVRRDFDALDQQLINTRPLNEDEKEAQLRAIIKNFETRISIIEKVLDHVQEDSKPTKNESNETGIQI